MSPVKQWQLLDSQLTDEEVKSTVINAFRQLYETHFKEEMLVNHSLPIEIRAFRHTDVWRIFLLLTPWFMARVFLPERDPGISLPPGWQADQRVNATVTVIGPAIPLAILGGRERAHLNYHPMLGHYLIQPLIQSMAAFNTSDDAFLAWNEVITTRNRVIEEQQRRCDWQQEVSRREFFVKLRQRASAK